MDFEQIFLHSNNFQVQVELGHLETLFTTMLIYLHFGAMLMVNNGV
jgi:hypothetical protein